MPISREPLKQTLDNDFLVAIRHVFPDHDADYCTQWLLDVGLISSNQRRQFVAASLTLEEIRTGVRKTQAVRNTSVKLGLSETQIWLALRRFEKTLTVIKTQ